MNSAFLYGADKSRLPDIGDRWKGFALGPEDPQVPDELEEPEDAPFPVFASATVKEALIPGLVVKSTDKEKV